MHRGAGAYICGEETVSCYCCGPTRLVFLDTACGVTSVCPVPVVVHSVCSVDVYLSIYILFVVGMCARLTREG